MTAPLAGQRIGLLTASASRLGGGVFEAVVRQAAMIRDLGGDVRVFALQDAHSEADQARFGGVPVINARVRGPAQFGFAPSLVQHLLDAELDLLHLHGIWMYPSRAATLWAGRTGRPYLISPHGMLERWITARNRWKKTLARRGYELASWRAADRFHALTGAEAADVVRETGRTDCVTIPNPAPSVDSPANPRDEPVIAYIGRIHPKKNLLALISAWLRATRPAAATLEIAGWGEPADIAALERAVAQAGPSVRYLGPVFGLAKTALLGRARFLALPSLSEGLPMAVLEGWAHGVPAILTPQCNLPEGVAAGAAIACGTTPESITQALQSALAIDDARWAAMAHSAQGLAAGPFSTTRIAASWAAAYRGERLA
jgi:poly(glycerol-phosphate) alpha-glucosyltransferase